MDSNDLSTIVSLFNPRARRVLDYARKEAARRHADAVGTLHLMCGLAQEGHGLLTRVFGAAHLSLGSLCEETGGNQYPIAASVNAPDLLVSLELDGVIRLAAEEAHTAGRADIGTAHLLLGMLRAGDSEAGKLLHAKGMSLEAVRGQLSSLTSQPVTSLRLVPSAIPEVTTEALQTFADAWNRHDVDALMSFMTEDCVFESSAGPDACGTRYAGQDAVRAAFAAVWAVFPDAHWGDARHFVHGDRGVSEWTFTGTRADGSRVEVHGCDLFIFRDGKIALKNSYRKNRPPSAAPSR